MISTLKSAYHKLASWNYQLEERLLDKLSPREKADMQHLRGLSGWVWTFKWTAITGIFCLVIAGLATLSWPKVGFWFVFSLLFIIVCSIAFGLFSAWYGSSRFKDKSLSSIALRMVFYTIVGGLTGYTAGTLADRKLTESWGELIDPSKAAGVIAILLTFASCYAVLVVIITYLRRRDNESYESINALKLATEQQKRLLAQSQLRNLQAQIEPHFLFNTLNLLRHEIGVDTDKAQSLVDDLVRLLRELTKQHEGEHSTVMREVNVVQAYLSIMQKRMGNRLQTQQHIAPNAQDFPIIPGLLLTLVENAIKHGLEPSRAGGTVTVEALLTGPSSNRLELKVQDNGVGLSDQPGTGVGLTNIREQLKTAYGDAAGLEAQPLFDAQDKPCGFTANIWIEQAAH